MLKRREDTIFLSKIMVGRNILIREATLDDLDEIFRLYSKFMFDPYLLKFGSPFVKKYLKIIIESKNCLTLVAVNEKPVGFIMAAFDDRKMFFELISNIEIMYIWVSQILAHPSIAFGSLELATYSFKTRMRNVNEEFLFIAIDPAYQKKTIATNLINQALDVMRLNGITKVKVTTLVKNDAINALLKKIGFKIEKTFKLFRRNMYLYSYSLA